MKPMNVNELEVVSSPRNNSGKLLRTIRKYPLIFFFTFTYLISTLLWLPAIFQGIPVFSDDYHLPSIYVLPGIAVGVTGVAILMSAITNGTKGVKRLLKGFVQWRVGFKWYLFVLLALPIAGIVTGSIISGGVNTVISAFAPSSLLLYPAAFASHLYFGPLFEEAGWRGFALLRMQEKFGALKGTFLLGLLWGLWHLPLYLPINIAESGLTGGLADFAAFMVSAIGLAVIFTWVYNNTKGSLLIAVLLHGSINGTGTFIQTLRLEGIISSVAAWNIQIGSVTAILLFAVFLLIITRGKLGYRNE